MGIGISGAAKIPDQFSWSADVIAPMAKRTSGAEDSAATPLTCSMCDILVLSLMLDVEGIKTSGAIEIFHWIHNAHN